MAWTAPRTWVTGEIVTAALLNTHVRDNLLETAPAAVTTAGDIVYADAANSTVRLAVGAASQILKGGASAPAWSDTIDGDLKLSTVSKHLHLLESDAGEPLDAYVVGHQATLFTTEFFDNSGGTYTEMSSMAGGDFALHTSSAASNTGAVRIVTDVVSGPTALTTSGTIICDALALETGGPAYVEGWWIIEIERTSAASVSQVSIVPREDASNLSSVWNYGSSETGIADIIPGAGDIHTFTGSFYRRLTATDTSDYELFVTADTNSRFQVNRAALYVKSIQYPN